MVVRKDRALFGDVMCATTTKKLQSLTAQSPPKELQLLWICRQNPLCHQEKGSPPAASVTMKTCSSKEQVTSFSRERVGCDLTAINILLRAKEPQAHEHLSTISVFQDSHCWKQREVGSWNHSPGDKLCMARPPGSQALGSPGLSPGLQRKHVHPLGCGLCLLLFFPGASLYSSCLWSFK